MKRFGFVSSLFVLIASLLFISSCNNQKSSENKNPIILIETDLGNIKIMLYNETPIHRDNFIKLVNEKFYDGIVFHRVINSFMIQGGDPTTKINSDSLYTTDDSGYLIDAEIIPSLFHKKGVIAAARMGDNVNPEKKSSGSQFYIVQGKVFTEQELMSLEKKKNENRKKMTINNMILERANKLIDKGENPDFNKLNSEMKDTIDLVLNNLPEYKFSDQQIAFYTSIGGTPHLDGDYTVFGEVIEGLEVVDRIAAVETDNADRPLKDIKMSVKVVSQ